MSKQTINPLPTAGSNFLEVLRAFLLEEAPERFTLQFAPFVVSGGIHGTVVGLTAAPSALVAFPGGFYTTEIGAITYADASTTWVIADSDTIGDLGGYTRVAGTHYLTAVVSTPLPSGTLRLMRVTTSGGAITAVVDERQLSPLVNSTTSPFLRLIGLETSGTDLFLRENAGNLEISENVGALDEPALAVRFRFDPANFPLILESGVTTQRTQQFPDKDGTFAMLSDISSSAFAAGTRMLFDNDTAPTGWTRVVTLDDRVVRIVSGARADGGSWTVSGLTAAGHSLTIAEMPAHTHLGESGNAFAMLGGGGVGNAGTLIGAAGNTAAAGSGNQHTHNISSDASWRPLHRDVILASRD